MSTPILSLRIETEWHGGTVAPEHWITVHILDTEPGIQLRVTAPFYGDPSPPAGPVGPTDGLWEFEVVEVFLAGPGEHYLEIELSPTGHYLVLELDGIRNPVQTLLPIDFQAEIIGDQWTGVANIPVDLLPSAPLRINATAIHGAGQERMYLSAVPLPGQHPDFHQVAYFRSLS
jgi:hypothetical protein